MVLPSFSNWLSYCTKYEREHFRRFDYTVQTFSVQYLSYNLQQVYSCYSWWELANKLSEPNIHPQPHRCWLLYKAVTYPPTHTYLFFIFFWGYQVCRLTNGSVIAGIMKRDTIDRYILMGQEEKITKKRLICHWLELTTSSKACLSFMFLDHN